MEFTTKAEEWLIAGYVFFSMGLNIVSFLISAFYQKKVNSHSPSLGFLLSLLLSAVFIGTLLVAEEGDANTYLGIVRTTSLLGCSMSSTLSVIGLFFSMRKTR